MFPVVDSPHYRWHNCECICDHVNCCNTRSESKTSSRSSINKWIQFCTRWIYFSTTQRERVLCVFFLWLWLRWVWGYVWNMERASHIYIFEFAILSYVWRIACRVCSVSSEWVREGKSAWESERIVSCSGGRMKKTRRFLVTVVSTRICENWSWWEQRHYKDKE
jgi:hypothetical protein